MANRKKIVYKKRLFRNFEFGTVALFTSVLYEANCIDLRYAHDWKNYLYSVSLLLTTNQYTPITTKKNMFNSN